MKIELYPGTGKTEIEIQRITELSSLSIITALPAFRGRREVPSITTRLEVESMNIDRLVSRFGGKVDVVRFRHFVGRTSHTIAGYENDARELHEIPEVRRFYSSAFELCPALIPAADLRNECLRVAVLCTIPNLTIIRRAQW